MLKPPEMYKKVVGAHNIFIIIIIMNINGWAIWPVPSPELQLLSPYIIIDKYSQIYYRYIILAVLHAVNGITWVGGGFNFNNIQGSRITT
jgi:hypothetical protein